MSTSGLDRDARAVGVEVTPEELIVQLADGRRVAAPLRWFPRLVQASADQRKNWELLGDGQGIHWPEVDEDLSVVGLLRGGDPSEAAA